MIGYYKWIGAFLGFYLGRFSFLGAIVGFLIGGFVDNFQRAAKYLNENNGENQQQRFRGGADFFQHYQQQQAQRYDFPTVILMLSAAVMKADQKVLKSELQFVKNFMSQQFGPQFNKEHLQRLKEYINKDQLPIQQLCAELKMRTPSQVREQLVQYLFGIAKSDGHVSQSEEQVIKQIALLMGVQTGAYQNMQQQNFRNISEDYATLGLSSAATDPEIKKAYRKLAVRYHPDKVSQLDTAEQEKAKVKFQQIQDAYEAIKKEREI